MGDSQFKEGDYILYMAQCANFQTRSILIPAQQFLDIRANDYEILKRDSIKNYEFKMDNNKYIVNNLLIHQMVPCDSDKKMFMTKVTEYSKVCGDLMVYAEGMDGYLTMSDKDWYDNSIIRFCEGFNHIKNYCKYKDVKNVGDKSVNIVDSFLSLDMENGVIRISPYDTENEILNELF